MDKRENGPRRAARAAVFLLVAPLSGCAYESFSPAESTASTDTDAGTVSESFVVSGTLTGLHGSGLVLQNNGIDDIGVGVDGSFAFPAVLASGSTYDVTVSLQPTSPAERCVVANGHGTVSGAVAEVAVTCTLAEFAVGGHVDGLDAIGLVLANRGEEITLAKDGDFVFFKNVELGSAYAVTIAQQPDGETCSLAGGSGTMGAGHELEVAVKCAAN